MGTVGTRVDSLVRLGDSTYRSDRDSAVRIWHVALGEAAGVGDSASIARALTGIGMAARVTGDWADSRRIGEQALALKQRLGLDARDLFRSFNALGLLAWNEERLSDASALFESASRAAREAADSIALGIATMNMGLVAWDRDASMDARRLLATGRDIARLRGDSTTLGRALNNMAMVDIALGDPLNAIASLEEARRLARVTGDSVLEVNARGQLATAYGALGEPQRAFDLLDSALAMAQRRGQRQEVAENLMLIADLFVEAGDHQHALDYYQRALAETDTVRQPEEHGMILRSAARAHAATADLHRADSVATEALRVHSLGQFAYEELADRLLLAILSQRLGRSTAAEDHLRAAGRIAASLDAPIAQLHIAIATARVAAEARQWTRVLETIQRIRPALGLAGAGSESEALALQARALAALGRNDAALAAGRLAITAIERVRGNYTTGELRTAYTSSKTTVFSDQAMLLLRLGRTEEAFEVADAARGRSLLEHLAEARETMGASSASESAMARETLLRRIDELLGRLRVREQTPPRERSIEFIAATTELRDSADAMRAEYAALAARAGPAPGSANILGTTRPSTADILASLQPGEVLLEYLVTGDSLVIFAARREGVSAFVSAERGSDLASRVQLARELLRQPGREDESSGVLRALYDLVLGPPARAGVLRTASRLIVVPHGVLTYLPFAALINPASARYVAQEHVLLHLPTSAALPALRRSSPGAPRSTRGSASVFAPVPRELRATEAEARVVERALRPASVHIGARATEARLRQALAIDGVVHVAGHAALNAANPLFSRIELAGATPRRPEDNGRLEVHEVLGLRLVASLVFLSGCETAIGGAWSTQFESGEDYTTIGQALLYAGAKNVVATLWRIDDAGAGEFAARFYEVLGSRGVPEALAAAQRKLIDDPRYATPYFWAAYQVSGSGLTGIAGANPGSLSDKR